MAGKTDTRTVKVRVTMYALVAGQPTPLRADEVVELPAADADALVAAGYATDVQSKAAGPIVETADDKAAAVMETADARPQRRKRKG